MRDCQDAVSLQFKLICLPACREARIRLLAAATCAILRLGTNLIGWIRMGRFLLVVYTTGNVSKRASSTPAAFEGLLINASAVVNVHVRGCGSRGILSN